MITDDEELLLRAVAQMVATGVQFAPLFGLVKEFRNDTQREVRAAEGLIRKRLLKRTPQEKLAIAAVHVQEMVRREMGRTRDPLFPLTPLLPAGWSLLPTDRGREIAERLEEIQSEVDGIRRALTPADRGAPRAATPSAADRMAALERERRTLLSRPHPQVVEAGVPEATAEGSHCPICGSLLPKPPELQPQYADVELVSCRRCGRYLLSGLLRYGQLPSATDSQRLALSRFVRRENDRTDAFPTEPLVPANFEASVKAGAPASGAKQQLDELVQFIALRAPNLGDRTPPEPTLAWMGRLGLPTERHFDSLIGAATAKDLIDHAIRLDAGHVFGLTVEGYERAEALRAVMDPVSARASTASAPAPRVEHAPTGATAPDRRDTDRTSSRSLRILHISDLHERARFEGMPADREYVITRDRAQRGLVLGDRFYEALSGLSSDPVDLVCFTGDVADWGHPAEYDAATARIAAILDAVQVPRERFFAVPGNHDVQRTIHEDAWKELRRWHAHTGESARLGRWFNGDQSPWGIAGERRDQLLARTAAFWTWMESFGRGDLRPRHGALLGYRHSLRLDHMAVPLHVVGLDSAWFCGGDDDQGKILLTEEQVLAHVRDGERALDGFRIALVHHPLDHLADHHDVRRLLGDNGVDVLLHGHQHSPIAMIADEPGARLRILAAGCLFEGELGKNWPNGFHLLEVDVASRTGAVHFRRWSRGARSWQAGSDIYRHEHDGSMAW